MLAYLDPTALTRLCVPGPRSALVGALWRRADTVVTARLSQVQVRAALDGIEPTAAWAECAPGIAFVELVGPVVARSAELAAGGLDPLAAVQVASALTVQHDDTVVVTWDAVVAGELRRHGMRVVP